MNTPNHMYKFICNIYTSYTRTAVKVIKGTFFITTPVLITVLIIISMTSPARADSMWTSVNVGIWTEHLTQDCTCLNEDNKLIQVTVGNEKDYFINTSRFINSHYVESYTVGAGREIDHPFLAPVRVGMYLTAIKGYEGHLKTHYSGILFAPVVYYKYSIVKFHILGPVINLGLEWRFK